MPARIHHLTPGSAGPRRRGRSRSGRSASRRTRPPAGEQRHRGHFTRSGNRHARCLLVVAAWDYRHAPRRPAGGPDPSDRCLAAADPAVSPTPLPHWPGKALDRRDRPRALRVLVGRDDQPATTRGAARRLDPERHHTTLDQTDWGRRPAREPGGPRCVYVIPTRELVRGSQRPATVLRSRLAHLSVDSHRQRKPVAPPRYPDPP